MKLRKATRDDIPAIDKIIRSPKNREIAAFPFVPKVVLQDFIDKQQDGDKRHHLWVAEDKGDIVGFIRYLHRLDGITKLHELGVHDDRQKQGIGAKLMDKMEHSAATHGQQSLAISVPAGAPSIPYYKKKLGYKVKGHVQGRKRTLHQFEKPVPALQNRLKTRRKSAPRPN